MGAVAKEAFHKLQESTIVKWLWELGLTTGIVV